MLKLEKVSKQYLNGKGITNISITFQPGEITGILGRNGSGKSTLFKSILELIPIDSGTITFHDHSISSQYEKVAYITEEGSSLPNLSATDYGHFLKRYYPSFDYKKYENLLDRFEINLYDKIKENSRGQQLKLEIAAGFAMNGELMILDEPFTTLDVYAKEDVIKLLIEQLHEDITILIATHNIEEIEQVVDRCIFMDRGNVVEDIQMDDLYQKDMNLKKLFDKYKK